jgi:FlaA1/EpsC-like NDP-sugar epimerase
MSPPTLSTVANQTESPFPAVASRVLRERVMNALRRLLELFDRRVGSHGSTRFIAILLVYTLNLGAAFYLAYQLRWDFALPGDFQKQCLELILPVVLCKLVLLHSFGQFRSILSYFGLADFGGVVIAISAVSAMMLGLWYWSEVNAAPPRGVIVMDFLLSVGLITSFRLSLRVVRSWAQLARPMASAMVERRVAIIGAGDVGEALAKDLLQHPGSGLHPVFFIDDDLNKVGRSIHGLPVYGPVARLVKLGPRLRINELVITQTDATPKRVKEIVELGREIGATAQIVPSFTQLTSGEVKIERSRPVAIEDLLGRAPVNLDSHGIGRLLRDRVVLVTGAGGSIGSELCRQILAQQPRQLLMVDQTELALFEIEQELIGGHGARLLPLIVDVADEPAIGAVFAKFRPSIVFHAAAHKHVPLMERQPGEALKNNTLATAGLARLAAEHGVGHFVLISTDKAINPTSVMGCSKRLAEKTLQARQRAPGNRTAFLAVRFGNVLGSSGSVIPTFKRQIAQGGPVTVTHADMTRYFMTIPEAVGLVLQTATLGQGGEIFILDMGQPVKIFDMARQMIELSGYKPGVDIEIKITGLRPGEKLFEELRHTGETHEPTEHPRIFRLRNELAAEDAEPWLAELRAAAATSHPPAIKQLLQRLVPEYTPFTE